jgi:parallel beta-helix repeat protein
MDDTVTWYSDDPAIAEVDRETGVIEAVSKGCSSVTAETANGLTAECTVWVTQTDEEDIDEFGGESINNYTTNYYDINYDVTVNPTITTDTNNFLASTGDTTDRSGDIAAMLKKTGCCILGSGVFYIKGVTMPANTMIRGQGNSTHVYWVDEDDSPNYIFKLGSRCSLSDMWIRQYKKLESDRVIDVQAEVRDFSAVEFSGTFTNEEGFSVSGPVTSTLSNLLITDIKGSGIKLSRTGTSILAHVAAVNCFIFRCDCGIQDDVFSEFHQFTNISCNTCYYGVICRGGNNTFNNCNFSGNYVGVYLDNSGDSQIITDTAYSTRVL